jgi:hypothetical protein
MRTQICLKFKTEPELFRLSLLFDLLRSDQTLRRPSESDPRSRRSLHFGLRRGSVISVPDGLPES